MKIIYICSYNPLDKLDRSGVPYSIYHQLQLYYQVVWIKPQYVGIYKIWDLFMRIIIYLGRICGYTINERNVVSAKIKSKYIQSKIDKMEYDAIFSLNTYELAFIKTDKPIYLRIDAIYPSGIDYYIFNMPKLIQRWSNNLECRSIEKMQTIFAPSMWIIKEIEKYYPHIPAEKLYLLETGANLDENFINYKHHLYSTTSDLQILFVGIDVKRKGIDVAFETTSLLNNKYKIKATLNVIGGKPEDSILESKFVKYWGAFDKNVEEEYNSFYKVFESSDIFLFPTRAEYHGIVNCEAAAYGLPIFSYDTGGVSSYVINGINGYTLDLNSGAATFAKLIYDCIKDGSMERLSCGSRNLYERKFNWNVWGKKVFEIICKNKQL